MGIIPDAEQRAANRAALKAKLGSFVHEGVERAKIFGHNVVEGGKAKVHEAVEFQVERGRQARAGGDAGSFLLGESYSASKKKKNSSIGRFNSNFNIMGDNPLASGGFGGGSDFLGLGSSPFAQQPRSRKSKRNQAGMWGRGFG